MKRYALDIWPELYADYFNNFLTPERFAEYYNMSIDHAKDIIAIGMATDNYSKPSLWGFSKNG